MNPYYLLAAVVVLLISAALLAPRKKKLAPPPGAMPGDLILRASSYKSGSRRYLADSGTLVVPENRSRLGSRLIALPVLRIRSSSASPAEPIFHLAGGPGVSNMRFRPPDELLANHDIVLVGYRGVDRSSVLDCPEFEKAVLGDGKSILGDTSLDLMTRAVRLWLARTRSAGVDLAGYTLPEVIEDLETARLKLGYERVNLLSESYGTRLAQVYAALHPRSLHRSAMIGVNPPGRFVWEPQMVDAQIAQYGRLWAHDDAASVRTADLAQAVRTVSHNMPARWLLLPIDPGKVNAAAFVLLFNRKTAAQVFDAYVAAAHGDASGLALMGMAYDFMLPGAFVWGDLFAKGASADMDLKRDYAATLQPQESIMGSPIAWLAWAPLSRARERELAPGQLLQPQPSDVETLLLSGSVDFSTPAEYARDELLPTLRNGTQVIFSEAGHVPDIWKLQPEATLRMLTTFYLTGEPDTSLLAYVPMDFKVGLGFPRLAKLLTVTLILPFLGLVIAVRRLLGRAH